MRYLVETSKIWNQHFNTVRSLVN